MAHLLDGIIYLAIRVYVNNIIFIMEASIYYCTHFRRTVSNRSHWLNYSSNTQVEV